MHKLIQLQVIPAKELSTVDQHAIQDLCTRAYGAEVWCDYAYLKAAFHVVGRDEGCIIAHALWVNRQLSISGQQPLTTAYVEYVATEPAYQGQGLASQLLRFLVDYIQKNEVVGVELQQEQPYELAALAPEDSGFYERLGWELWQGDLYVRDHEGLISTPDDDVMIYRLAMTPQIAVTDDLSAEWREGELW